MIWRAKRAPTHLSGSTPLTGKIFSAASYAPAEFINATAKWLFSFEVDEWGRWLTFARAASELHRNNVVAEKRLYQIINGEWDYLERRQDAKRKSGAAPARKGALRDDGCDARVSGGDFNYLCEIIRKHS